MAGVDCAAAAVGSCAHLCPRALLLGYILALDMVYLYSSRIYFMDTVN